MITGFQLRAAKATSGLYFMDIVNAVGLDESTIMRLRRTKNLELLKARKTTINLLVDFFASINIIFPAAHTIAFKTHLDPIPITDDLTKFQFKAARIATGLTQEELSPYIKVSSSSMSILERLSNIEYIEYKKTNILLIKRFFEGRGIIFPNDFTVTLVQDPYKLLEEIKNS